MTRFALFCCYLALGLVLGLLFVGVSALGRKLHVGPVTVVLDLTYSFAAVFSAALLAYFFNDGIMALQNIAALSTFFIPLLLFRKKK